MTNRNTDYPSTLYIAANNNESMDWYPRYRIVLTGNIQEFAVGLTPIDIARKFENESFDVKNDFMFGEPRRAITPNCSDGWASLYKMPTWPDFSETLHMTGFIVDDNLRVTIEDYRGDDIYDLTGLIRRQAGSPSANDNNVIYEVGDYNGISRQPEFPDDEATTGIFNVRSYEKGMFTYTFELDEVIDPKLVQIPLQDLTTYHLTAGVYYDGFPAYDFESCRWTVKPPQALFGLGKMAA